MTALNTHIINKQVIELKVGSEDDAFRMQQEVRDAYLENVLPLISEVLDEVAGPDEVLRIDRLELDFGTIHSGKVVAQMKSRVREALLKQLPALRQKIDTKEKAGFAMLDTVADGKRTSVQLMSESFSQRELLAAYFETGFLPWWATDEIAAPDVDELLISLLEKEQAITLQWLQALAIRSPWAVQRLVLQVEKKTRDKIVAVFPARLISTLQPLLKQVQQVQSKINSYTWQSGQGDALLFSALILSTEALIVSNAKSAPAILENLIAQLAVVYRADATTITQQLYAATVAELIASPANVETLPDLVNYFREWEKQNPESVLAVTGNAVPVLKIISENETVSINELITAIERSLIAFEAKLVAYRIRRKKENLKRKNQKQEQEETTELQNENENAEENAEDSSVENNFTVVNNGLLNEAVAAVSEELIEPVDSVKTNEVYTDENETVETEMPSVKINWFKTTDDQQQPEKIAGADFIVQQEETKAQAEKNEIVSANQPIKNTIVAAEFYSEESASLSISEEADDADEAEFIAEEHPMLQKKPSAGMTRFAGLVLIAPFLPAFFAELKLVEDGKFTSEAQQHKALHLLNYIASGKTASPEYALLLHKMLCGIELTAPVPKSVKLSAAEKKEAILFLDDVAEQWTALRGTSGKGFRETFFRRNGVLEKKDNFWLLRVERGPMDIMLDTLPWTFSIIKAPWMQQLLQTEW